MKSFLDQTAMLLSMAFPIFVFYFSFTMGIYGRIKSVALSDILRIRVYSHLRNNDGQNKKSRELEDKRSTNSHLDKTELCREQQIPFKVFLCDIAFNSCSFVTRLSIRCCMCMWVDKKLKTFNFTTNFYCTSRR